MYKTVKFRYKTVKSKYKAVKSSCKTVESMRSARRARWKRPRRSRRPSNWYPFPSDPIAVLCIWSDGGPRGGGGFS